MNDKKTVNDTSVQIYDAKLKDSGDNSSGVKNIATKNNQYSEIRYSNKYKR